jgi:hypothetical protein
MLTLPFYNLDIDGILKAIDNSIFDILYLYLYNSLLVYEKGKTEIQPYNISKIDVLEVRISTLKALDYPESEYQKYEKILVYLQNGGQI